MTGNWSIYLRNKMLDHVLGGGDYARPATIYVALFTARGTDAEADANTGFTVVSTGVWTNYARKSVTNNATNFPAASTGAKSSGADIAFAASTIGGGASVVVAAIGIYDASTSGNLLGWADLPAAKRVKNGTAFTIPAGNLGISQL